jgi:hypothetical protein
MKTNDFLHEPVPDYNIYIGIKEDKAVRIDWSELFAKKKEFDDTEKVKEVKEFLIKRLEEAIEILKK